MAREIWGCVAVCVLILIGAEGSRKIASSSRLASANAFNCMASALAAIALIRSISSSRD